MRKVNRGFIRTSVALSGSDKALFVAACPIHLDYRTTFAVVMATARKIGRLRMRQPFDPLFEDFKELVAERNICVILTIVHLARRIRCISH